MKLIGHEAIQYAADKGLTLNKYADPIEDAQAGLSIERAEAVAAEDPGLIWVDCRELLRTEFEHAGETYLVIVWECPEAPRDGRSGNATVYRVGKVGVCSYRASGIYAAPDLDVEGLDDATHDAARQALNRMHTRDEHCVLRKLSPYAYDSECMVCSVTHGDPCPDCGKRAFHTAECEALARQAEW